MSILDLVNHWFRQPTTWSGPESIPTQVAEHLFYSFLALIVAAVIAKPLGLHFGYACKGEIVVLTKANSIRACQHLLSSLPASVCFHH
ncbi:hypothetical protein OK351_17735 [Glutamicibacter sp. MNS18]|uniref:hypothetical protein n=1 Tax=Glutamicibacter sp. MNS18 TaxID=2989817 RepID=UPI002236339E|nr:hypothetical protein [Glutamicibacter sp. MNS18]MCW4467321.1 hypothetical protein [Glutamicibacter sp. MNS18]